MRLEEKKETRKKIYLILALFLVLIIFNLLVYLIPVEYERVKIFILDDFQQGEEPYGNLSISHGELVRDVIAGIDDNLVFNLHNVSSDSGIKEELYLDGLVEAIDYKRQNPKQEVIINISLSFSAYSSEHKEYITKAIDEGIVIVAAAGNDNSTTPIYPAGFSDVVAVANAQRISKAQSSNYGEYIDLSAPGDAGGVVTGSLARGFGFSYIRTSGTSFSAPRLVGTLAKILELDKNLTAEQGLELIKENTNRIFAEEYQAGELGAGLLNYNRVLKEVDFKYWLIERLAIITLFFILLLASMLLLWKYKIAGVFFTILLFIILFPSALFISENAAEALIVLYDNSLLLGFNNLILALIFVSGVVIYKFSYWIAKVKLAALFLLIVINLIMLNYQISLEINYLLTIFFACLIIIIEWSLARKVKNKNNIKYLLSKLDSNSNKVQRLAKQKLVLAQEVNYEKLKQELAKSNSVVRIINLLDILARKEFEQSKALLFNYLSNPQLKLYLTAFKYLAKDSTYTTELIDFAARKKLSKGRLLSAFKDADKAVIKELLLLFNNNNQRQQELVVIILKSQDCKKIISILETVFTPKMQLDKLWQSISNCQIKSAVLSEQLIDLVFRTEEMWTCYYVLKILFKLHPYPKNLVPVLEILKDRQEEVISLEAKEILEEIEALD